MLISIIKYDDCYQVSQKFLQFKISLSNGVFYNLNYEGSLYLRGEGFSFHLSIFKFEQIKTLG